MKRILFVAIGALFVFQPAATSAQITDAPRVPNSQEYLQFLGGSGQGSYLMPSYQVGPYRARFVDMGPPSGPTTPEFSIICVDFNHTAQSRWVNTAGIEGGDLSTTRAGAGSLVAYRKAAYLGALFDTGRWQSINANRKIAWSAIHGAIWSIMNGATGVGPVPVLSSNALVAGLRDGLMTDAAAAVGAGYTADGWYVVTPQNLKYGQEFLIRTNVVPEPSTYILLATGLLLIVGFGRKRMRSLSES